MDENEIEDEEPSIGERAAEMSASNPYTLQLQEMLQKYMQREENVAREKRQILEDATKKLVAKAQPDKYTQAGELFKVAGAFLKPTRTGAFGETLGNVADVAGELVAKRGARQSEVEDLMMKYKLAGLDIDPGATKAKLGALTTLARNAPKEQPKGESERLMAIIEDPTTPAARKRMAQDRLNKLTYIAPSKEDKPAGPSSTPGKIASDIGLQPGTPAYQAKVAELTKTGEGAQLSTAAQKELFESEEKIAAGREVVLAFQQALKLNDIAYEGPTAGAREVAGRWIPIVSESQGQTATADLENIVLGTALTQLKAIFGAAPTEGERKILIDVQGSINKPAATRKAIWERAQKAAARRIEENRQKMERIRSGAYLKYDSGNAEFYKGGRVRMEEGGLSPANVGRSAAQGLMLGYGDEAIARVRARMEGRPYEEVLAEERLKLKQFGERYPMTALGTEFVGAAAPTAAMMLVPGGQVPGAARLAALGSRFPKALRGTTAKTAGIGATTGAIAGSGTAVEGERGMGAVTGGATGAVAGPIVAKSTDVAGSFGKGLYDFAMRSPKSVEDRAMSKVLQAMGRDEIDPAEIKRRMGQERAMGTDAMLMDVSPSMQTLGEAVVTTPGSGRAKLGEPLAQRLEEGRERVGERVLKTVGKGIDFTKEEASLVGKLRANAQNVYDKAYAVGSVNDPRILRVLEDDTFKKAFDEARQIANKEARAAELRGEDASRFKLQNIYEVDPDGNVTKINIPDVRTLDYMKRGIDALVDKGYKGAGMSSAEATALKDLKKEFVKVIDENVPEYAAARAQYAGDIEVLDALRLGRESYLSPKTTPTQAKELVAQMSQGERDALRAGVAQAALDKIMNAPQQVNAAMRVIGAPATKKRLEVLFDNPAEYKLFEAALAREGELFRNAQEVIRNSRTANKKEAIEDLKKTDKLLDIAGEAVSLTTGGTGTVVGRVLQFMEKARGIDEKTADRLAEILRTKDPVEIDRVLKGIESRAGAFEKQARFRSATQTGVSGATGSVTQQPASVTTSEPKTEEEDEDADAIVERLLRGENQ